GQNDRPDILDRAQAAEEVAQLGIALEGEWVLALGPVERDCADAVFDSPADMNRTKLRRFHVRLSLSRAARLSLPSSSSNRARSSRNSRAACCAPVPRSDWRR